MRVIEQKMVNAVRNNKNFSNSNTTVVRADVEKGFNVIKVYLHGNLIYGKNVLSGEERFNNCGWYTNTTKSRLNALGANIRQKNWEWYNEDGSVFKNQNVYSMK